MLGLTEFLQRKPKALSGGQRQRVAMGRAIVRNPQVFCMDEPLSNLDAKMRVQTRTDIARLQTDLGVTTVYVTHDQVEAMTMGDRVAVMKLGHLQQVDTPLRALRQARQPVRGRVHRLPEMNLLEGVASGDQVSVGGYSVPVDPAAERKMNGPHHRRRTPRELAHRHRRRGWPAGQRDRRRGARRRQLRLRHQRRGGGAVQRDRQDGRPPPPRRRARRSTSRPTRSTCTSSTPTPGSASPTDEADEPGRLDPGSLQAPALAREVGSSRAPPARTCTFQRNPPHALVATDEHGGARRP